MSVSTFKLIGLRALVSLVYHAIAAKLVRACFWFCFRCWRPVKSRVYWRHWWCSSRGPCATSLCFKEFAMNCRKRDLTPIINRARSADLEVWLTGKARALEEAALECCSRQLNALLRLIKPWAPMRDFRLADEHGRPATSDRAERIPV